MSKKRDTLSDIHFYDEGHGCWRHNFGFRYYSNGNCAGLDRRLNSVKRYLEENCQHKHVTEYETVYGFGDIVYKLHSDGILRKIIPSDTPDRIYADYFLPEELR